MKTRSLLYGAFALVSGGIVWACYFTKPLPDVATVVASAQMMAEVGALDDADRTVKDALKRDPRNLHAMLVKGFIEERRSAYPRAISAYERSLELTDDPAVAKDIRLSIADIRRRSGDVHGAIDAIAEIEAVHGKCGATDRLRGVCAIDREDYEGALALLSEASARADAPDDVHALDLTCHIKRNDWSAARREVECIKAAGRDPSPYWYRVAGAMAAHGDEAEAAAVLAEFVKANPKNKGRLKKDPFWGPFAEKDRFRVLFD